MEALRRLLIVFAIGWLALGLFALLISIEEVGFSWLWTTFGVLFAVGPPVGIWWIAQGLKK